MKKGDRVRHIDKSIDIKYGVMEIWEIKNDYATCRYGDYYNMSLVSFKISELRKE